MFHIAFTPMTSPADALSAKAPTLLGAIGELLKSLDCLNDEMCNWYIANILEATKDAVAKMEDCEPAKGTWSDMGCEDDAFSIDIFEVVEPEAAATAIGSNRYPAIYIRLGDQELLAPHGAVGFVLDKHCERWIYDDHEIAEWDNVMLVSLPSDGPTHNGPTETGPSQSSSYYRGMEGGYADL